MASDSFSFDITKTRIYRAVWLEDYLKIRIIRRLRKIALGIAFISIFGSLILFLVDIASQDEIVRHWLPGTLLGIGLLAFAYAASAAILELFVAHLKNSIPANTANIAAFLSYELAQAAAHASKSAQQSGSLDTAALIAALLDRSMATQFVFDRGLLDQDALRGMFAKDAEQQGQQKTKRTLSPELQKALRKALQSAKKDKRNIIELDDLLPLLAETNETFQQFLVNHNLEATDIRNLARWYRKNQEMAAIRRKFWLPQNLRRYGSIGKDLAAGYTITLDRFGRELSRDVAALHFPRATGHHREKEAIERILTRTKNNNALLVGEPGSGRRRLVLDFVSKTAMGLAKNELLNYQRVIQLDLPYLISTLEGQEEVEATLDQVLREAVHAGNIILVIENIHDFIGEEAKNAPGKIDISGIVAPYLKDSSLPLIAISTYADTAHTLEHHPSFLAYFETIRIQEISQEETFEILEEFIPFFESRYQRKVSYPALKMAIEYAGKYIQSEPFPKKAIDLLEDSLVYLSRIKERVLLPKHIAGIVTEQTDIPVGELAEKERGTLLHLEQLLHRRVVGQEEALKEIASSLRRARTEIATRKGPMGSFLFLGPTGVGKTETAKALAAIYFGSEKRIIRLDMSEFQTPEDIARLLGSQEAEGLLTAPVRQHPFSLILLDELEKAHPDILNLFLQVLDEGHITDGLGRKTDFTNTIIIATSNAGYQIILEALEKKTDFKKVKEEILEYLFQQGIYRPEFLNRFHGVILFRPLSQENLIEIAGLMLGHLSHNMKQKGIEFTVTEELKEKIAELGYDPRFGARDMQRVIQDKVENPLAVALLEDRLQRGMKAKIDPETFTVQAIQ